MNKWDAGNLLFLYKVTTEDDYIEIGQCEINRVCFIINHGKNAGKKSIFPQSVDLRATKSGKIRNFKKKITYFLY